MANLYKNQSSQLALFATNTYWLIQAMLRILMLHLWVHVRAAGSWSGEISVKTCGICFWVDNLVERIFHYQLRPTLRAVAWALLLLLQLTLGAAAWSLFLLQGKNLWFCVHSAGSWSGEVSAK